MVENRKTLASVSQHSMRGVAKFGISAKQLANKLLSFDKNDNTENPDSQALRFYSLNQIIGLMSAKFTTNQTLPAWGELAVNLYCKELDNQHKRLFWYTFLVISREWRHLKNLGTVSSVKSKPYTAGLKAFHATLTDSNAEASLNSWLKNVPDMSLIDYCTCLTHSFNAGTWSGGYGGKPWGVISQTLLNYVSGVISGEVFIDTAYTLAHNNGPMFNKGMMYSQYSQEFKVILDIQRSGQVCEGLLDNEFPKAVPIDILELLRAYKSELGFGDYIDWYKVETLGFPLVQPDTYAAKKYAQDKKYGKKKAIALIDGAPIKITKTLEWYPGKTVDVFERMASV